MKLLFRSSLVLFSCSLVYGLFGQGDAYFQQEVDYRMSATLQPNSHVLAVVGQFTYTNNSPQSLDSLPIHLWANAYATRNGPYTKQKQRHGEVGLHFEPENALGGYRDLVLRGENVAKRVVRTPELETLVLTDPLRPGDSTRVAFSYSLVVPEVYSRMGRTGALYQLTQWYPKPALFDRTGWHIMPYLDLGEYFNDFGDYDVTITVPTNGIVAASGQLLPSPGADAHTQRVHATATHDTLHIDSLQYGEGQLSYRYQARQVTDFAWFVDPSFRVGLDSVQLRKGVIPAEAYYHATGADQWRQASELLARATQYADRLVGPYPYPKIAAVAAPLGVGGGMEYPMVTVIGPAIDTQELDAVLAHEAFHNWFQGMLASNERTHAWQDEGLTSWLEAKYLRDQYGPEGADLSIPKFFAKGSPYSSGAAFHAFLARPLRHPQPDTHSDSLTALGYGYAAYTQPRLLLEQLEGLLGEREFVSRIQAYAKQWLHKHPQPYDLQEALGGQDVDWLFQQLIADNELPDYRILAAEESDASVSITIENRGSVASPFPIAFELQDGSFTSPRWQAGFTGQQVVSLPKPKDAFRIGIDPSALTPELERKDNYYGLATPTPKIEPLAVHLLTHLGRPDRNNLCLVPSIGYNANDGVMLGVGFHNYTFTGGPTRFYLLPMVSTRDGALNGMVGINHSFYQKESWWRELEFSVAARKFSYNDNQTYDFRDRYQRITAGAMLYLAAEPGLPLDQRIGLRTHAVDLLFARGINAETRTFSKEDGGYTVVEADYSIRRNDILKPWAATLTAQGGEGFTRLSAVLEAGIRYDKAGNYARLRVFGGTFFQYDQPEARAALLPNGTTGFRNRQYDFTFEEFILDRSASSRQVFVRDGSLTLPFLLPVAESDSWLLSASTTIDLPVKLPMAIFKFYADAAVYPDTRAGASGVVLPVTGGLRLDLQVVSLSLPLFNSAFVREAQPFTVADPKYFDRIAFSLHLDRLNVGDLLRKIRG